MPRTPSSGRQGPFGNFGHHCSGWHSRSGSRGSPKSSTPTVTERSLSVVAVGFHRTVRITTSSDCLLVSSICDL
jgi:hypothetical protein